MTPEINETGILYGMKLFQYKPKMKGSRGVGS